VEIDRATGIFRFLSLFDKQGLCVIIVAYGTLGLHFVRHGVLEPEQRRPARWFGVALAGTLAVASATADNLPLVSVCVIVMIMHMVLPRLIED